MTEVDQAQIVQPLVRHPLRGHPVDCDIYRSQNLVALDDGVQRLKQRRGIQWSTQPPCPNAVVSGNAFCIQLVQQPHQFLRVGERAIASGLASRNLLLLLRRRAPSLNDLLQEQCAPLRYGVRGFGDFSHGSLHTLRVAAASLSDSPSRAPSRAFATPLTVGSWKKDRNE